MKEYGFAYASDVVAVVFTAVQPDEILKYICLGITILSCLFSIIFTIIQFFSWYQKAKADGVITKEEIEEGKKIVEDGLEDAKKHLDNK